MRWIVGGHAIKDRAAATSQMGSFETELLATDENLEALAEDVTNRISHHAFSVSSWKIA